MPRIIYISTKEKTPTGGIKVIFQHVRGLREMGFDACVGHPVENFNPEWFEADIPIVHYLKNFKVFADDVFVIPETGFNTLRLLKDIRRRKVMFCQNWYGIHQGLGKATHWREFGVDSVITCSNVVANCVRQTFDYDNVAAITCPVDQVLFKPREKRRQIAYMPRKRPQDLAQIRSYFQLLAPENNFQWVPIDNAPERQVASILGESAVFLSLSKREGLGLPPLEAMAAGCVVAGFHGVGGLEYATPSNGLWCQEEDLFDCARQVKIACDWVSRNDPQALRLVEQGRVTAAQFSYDHMKRDLHAFWGE